MGVASSAAVPTLTPVPAPLVSTRGSVMRGLVLVGACGGFPTCLPPSLPPTLSAHSTRICVTILPARAHFARSWPRQTPALSPSDLPIVAPTRLCPCTSTCSTLNQVLARSAQPHSQRASARFVGECRALIVAPRVAATDHEPGPSGHGD